MGMAPVERSDRACLQTVRDHCIISRERLSFGVKATGNRPLWNLDECLRADLQVRLLPIPFNINCLLRGTIMKKTQMAIRSECICGRKDPDEGDTCEICGTFFCGACKEAELIKDPEIDDEYVDITVCTECNNSVTIKEHFFHEDVVRYQKLIDNGMAWTLEGSVGRYAMELIEAGYCVLGEHGNTGSYGNYVPSRHEVKPGTKGSVEYRKKMTQKRCNMILP